MDSKDAAVMKKAEEELMAASHKMAEEMYKHTTAKAGAGDGPAGGDQGAKSGKEDVQDAEYKVEDEK